MGLLIWKALGYGIVFMVGFGSLFMIAAAVIGDYCPNGGNPPQEL